MASLDTTSPDVLRKAIIARLGIDPKKLAGFQGDPGFDTNITNLYRNETNRLGGYDTQEARLGSDYGTALANLNYQNDQASKNLMGTLADRGMAFSGAAVQGQADQAKQYQDQLNSLNTQRTRGLEDIGTARNNVNYDLLNQRGTYEADYGKNLSDFLQQQATAAAQLAQSKPVVNQIVTPAVTKKITTPARPKIPTMSAVQRKVAPQIAVKTTQGIGYRPKSGGVTSF